MNLLDGIKNIARSKEKRLVNIADLSDGFRGLLTYLNQLEDNQKNISSNVSNISSLSTQTGVSLSPLLLMGC